MHSLRKETHDKMIIFAKGTYSIVHLVEYAVLLG